MLWRAGAYDFGCIMIKSHSRQRAQGGMQAGRQGMLVGASESSPRFSLRRSVASSPASGSPNDVHT